MGKINRKDQHRTINYRDPADWRLQDGDARLITDYEIPGIIARGLDNKLQQRRCEGAFL